MIIMKKITLLLLMLTTTLVFGQAPTSDPADPPARDAGDVVAIFSATYTNISPGPDLNPNWGQSGFATANTNYSLSGSSNVMLHYPNFNYQGIDFAGNSQDISLMEFVHIDIWTNSTTVDFFLINTDGAPGERSISIPANVGSWTSLDIPIADFTNQGFDITKNLIQYKFAGGDGTTSEIFVDNLYFWKNPTNTMADATLSDLQIDGVTISGFASGNFNYTYEVAAGAGVPVISATTTQAGANAVVNQATQVPGAGTVVVTAENAVDTETYTVTFIEVAVPSDAPPTPPARDPEDVVSIYGEAYGTAIGLNNVPWDDPSNFNEEMIAGNNVLKIDIGTFVGSDLTTKADASSMTHFHMDYWIADNFTPGQVFNPKWSNHAGGNSETDAFEYTIALGSSADVQNWVSLDIPITDFSNANGNGVDARSELAQFIITPSGTVSTAYIDNVYFYKETTASTDDIALANLSAYPNPSSTSWNINVPNQTIKSIEVFNVLGRRVVSNTYNDHEVSIPVTSLASGIYLARVTTDAGTKTIKLIRE
jgi:hypothetical protein